MRTTIFVTRPWRQAMVALAVLGSIALAAGYLLLASWDVTHGGVDCGAPLDNPGWPTGSDCHGAVNRRTALGWIAVLNGAALLVVACTLLWMTRFSRVRPTTGQEGAC